MKKSLVLGAAALAAVVVAPTFAAAKADITVGGYYRVQVANSDFSDDMDDNREYTRHRLNLELDARTSPKTHAHMRWRPIWSKTIEGLNSPAGMVDGEAGNGSQGKSRMWLETEAWGVGVKAGKMPISFNDDVLFNSAHEAGVTSTGAIVLSKSFNDMTLVLADLKAAEGSRDNDEDDTDIWTASLLGKAGKANYQLTVMNVDFNDETGIAGEDDEVWYVAGTVGMTTSGVKWTATVVYEDGNDDAMDGTMAEEDGLLFAVRASGKAGFGGWNAYAFYGEEEYNSIGTQEGQWSYVWAPTGGMPDFAGQTTMPGEEGGGNMMGAGIGLKIKSSGWTINPMIDFAQVDEDIDGLDERIWGGTLKLSTMVDTGAKLTLIGGLYDPDETDSNHHLVAEMKILF